MTRILDLDKPRDPTFVKDLLLRCTMRSLDKPRDPSSTRMIPGRRLKASISCGFGCGTCAHLQQSPSSPPGGGRG